MPTYSNNESRTPEQVARALAVALACLAEEAAEAGLIHLALMIEAAALVARDVASVKALH
ncbi:hypothetical protein [Telmatospirillum sp. J64-1]|uniref:hypothetical protein n=1 Tax=Telmatospirillum sp. J64-1 TaxID=2502183 RepID=UPI00115C525F|nr:hypothetical protein [Telmatospirillum sp. J64-1]